MADIRVQDKAGNVALVNEDDVSTRALIAAGILTVVNTPVKPEPTKVTVWKKHFERGVALSISCPTCKSVAHFDGLPSHLEGVGKTLCVHVDKAEFAAACEQYRAGYVPTATMSAELAKAVHSQRKPDPPQHPLAGEWLN
jgi:hypothetical protein